MLPIYLRIRGLARRIVRKFPSPDFYTVFSPAIDASKRMFETDPLINRLRIYVERHIDNAMGHGWNHAVKVTIDAGALAIIECGISGYPEAVINRRVILTQCAGLLHDMKRSSDDHAVKGSEFARELLKTYPLSIEEIEDVSLAIRSHEAFKESIPIDTPEGILVSDCLYDADKFRWGPDNFTDTIWEMVSHYNTPFQKFMQLYPVGMEKLANVKSTFRTRTGKQYGPQFLDIGLAIGEELFKQIRTEFADLL